MQSWLPIYTTNGLSIGGGVGDSIATNQIGLAYIGVNYVGIGPTPSSGGNFRISSTGNRRISSTGNNRIYST